MATTVSLRMKLMDHQAIDVRDPNPERAVAEACAGNPDRFVAFATAALQFPEPPVPEATGHTIIPAVPLFAAPPRTLGIFRTSVGPEYIFEVGHALVGIELQQPGHRPLRRLQVPASA